MLIWHWSIDIKAPRSWKISIVMAHRSGKPTSEIVSNSSSGSKSKSSMNQKPTCVLIKSSQVFLQVTQLKRFIDKDSLGDMILLFTHQRMKWLKLHNEKYPLTWKKKKDEQHKSTCQFMGFKKQYFCSQQQRTSYFKKG